MRMSRSARIITLLVIDTLFFFLEIIVGYAVHSLALVADSFHMLNDVLSLLVALWAIKLSRQKSTSSYTYGWQRAEVLGALINGVFLVALCLSIFLEAVQRFFEPQVITNPVLILVVGSAGLASNLIGLALFHDHGHAHGTEARPEHEHSPAHDIEGMAGLQEDHLHDHHGVVRHKRRASHIQDEILDEHGPIEEILPETVVARTASAVAEVRSRAPSISGTGVVPSSPFTKSRLQIDPEDIIHTHGHGHAHEHHRTGSKHQRFADPVTSIHVLPAQNRQEIIDAAGRTGSQSSSDSEEEVLSDTPFIESDSEAGERTPLLASADTVRPSDALGHRGRSVSISHSAHHHERQKTKSKGKHSHQSLNMRGVFLHVLGDALGNIGVISTAIFIWKTDYSWRFYFDPAISLVITAIIFSSALPLVKSASKILLQAVPKGISLDEVKEDILSIKGVESVHELHIWQLSDVKMIASLHIQIAFDPEEDLGATPENGGMPGRGERYMKLARAIRTCLHAYGIHSSTIQPEYTPKDAGKNSSSGGAGRRRGACGSGRGAFSAGVGASEGRGADGNDDELGSEESSDTCLLECGDECGHGKCCGPMIVSDGHGHSH